MNTLRSAAILCVLIVSITVALTTAARAADVAGTYKCEGDNGSGGKYTGTVSIVKKGDTYRLTWKLGSKETYAGLGILQDNVLAVGYYGSMSGVVAYKVEADSKLVGKWAMVKGDGSVNTETLTK